MGRDDKVQVEVNAFPFPDQPTPPPTKLLSAPALDIEHAEMLSPLDPNDLEPMWPSYTFESPPHPFLINEGELNGTNVVRGGFGGKLSMEYSAKAMRSFPPPPNEAYALASQAFPRRDSGGTYTLMRGGSDQGTGVDISKMKGLQLSLVLGHKKLEKDLGEIAWNTNEKADVQDIMELELKLDLREDNNLDGATQDEKFAFESMNSIRFREQRFRSIPTSDSGVPASGDKTIGEIVADAIDFEREAWVMEEPGVSGELYSANEQREDYIRFINTAKPELAFCKKCHNAHIPPGPPITIEDRDTCGSELPDWFPADEYTQPWKQFRKMINDLVHLTELTQGYTHSRNPQKPVWSLQYHDYHQKWKAMGRRGGWWKCRDDEHATAVEKNCELCHVPKEETQAEDAKNSMTILERLKVIHDFIDFHMRRIAEQDKAICQARARAEGIPEYIGHISLEEVQFRNPVLSRHASASTIYSMHNRSYSIVTTYSNASHSATASPIKRSPLSEFSVPKDSSLLPQCSHAREHSPGDQGPRAHARGRSPPRGRSPIRRGRE